MRIINYLLVVVTLFLITSCGSSKEGGNNEDGSSVELQSDNKSDVNNILSSSDLYTIDSLSNNKNSELEEESATDELFEEFLYNFVSEDKFQLRRIKFPLKVNTVSGDSTHILKKNWKHNDSFANEDYYSVIFDKEDDIDLVADSALNEITIKLADNDISLLKSYVFSKTKKIWKLNGILEEDRKSDLDSFEDFLFKFVTDTVFQTERLKSHIIYVHTDPDNDFEILEEKINHEQWNVVRPQYCSQKLAYIDYSNGSKYDKKVVIIKGLANGYSTILFFKKEKGRWVLYKYEETSI